MHGGLRIRICVYAHEPWQHAEATTIACLHHLLLAHRGETSKIVREQVSNFTLHTCSDKCLRSASQVKESTGLKSRQNIFSLRNHMTARARDHDSMPTSLFMRQFFHIRASSLHKLGLNRMLFAERSPKKTL